VRGRLRGFCEDLAQSRFERYLVFAPTFARIDVDAGGGVHRAALLDYCGPESLAR
jgi:hypothetical protein